jgi:excisionase family DNA binding protein
MADLDNIAQRLERIEDLLQSLQVPTKEKFFYTTNEAAERLGKSTWYVRRLCSLGEIVAEKHPESGRFLISADELDRIETRRDALDD